MQGQACGFDDEVRRRRRRRDFSSCDSAPRRPRRRRLCEQLCVRRVPGGRPRGVQIPGVHGRAPGAAAAGPGLFGRRGLLARQPGGVLVALSRRPPRGVRGPVPNRVPAARRGPRVWDEERQERSAAPVGRAQSGQEERRARRVGWPRDRVGVLVQPGGQPHDDGRGRRGQSAEPRGLHRAWVSQGAEGHERGRRKVRDGKDGGHGQPDRHLRRGRVLGRLPAPGQGQEGPRDGPDVLVRRGDEDGVLPRQGGGRGRGGPEGPRR